MRILILGLLLLFLAACSTTSSELDLDDEPRPPSAIKRPRSLQRPSRIQAPILQGLDYEGLSRSMGMDPPRENLGYTEKAFDTCRAGYGYSASQDCRQNYFAVINFRILCRDSEGTVQVAIRPEDLRPLSGRMVSWNFANANGNIRLDNQGYGQIKMAGEYSLREERLKITSDNDFLYLRAGKVNRIVTPKNWCN